MTKTEVAQNAIFESLTQALAGQGRMRKLTLNMDIVKNHNTSLFDQPAAIRSLKTLLDDDEYAAVEAFVAAREKLGQIATKHWKASSETLNREVEHFKQTFTIIRPDGVSTMLSLEKEEPVSMTISGISSIHKTPEGHGGILTIKPCPRSSDTWPFQLKDGILYAQTEPDLY